MGNEDYFLPSGVGAAVKILRFVAFFSFFFGVCGLVYTVLGAIVFLGLRMPLSALSAISAVPLVMLSTGAALNTFALCLEHAHAPGCRSNTPDSGALCGLWLIDTLRLLRGFAVGIGAVTAFKACLPHGEHYLPWLVLILLAVAMVAWWGIRKLNSFEREFAALQQPARRGASLGKRRLW